MRIGPRCNVSCNSITTVGGTLPWVNNFRYLGIVLVQSRNFRCSLSDAKKSFYTANVDVQNLNTYFERLNVAITERVPAFMVFIVSTNVNKMNNALEH